MAVRASSPLQLTASDGHTFNAYYSTPEKAIASVVIIQEIFGINHHIRSVANDFASEGFFAIAPALFDRAERDVELPYNDEGKQRGRALAQKIGMEAPLLDIAAAIDYAAKQSAPTAVGVVGYCWGGTLAWLCATRLNPIAAVGYYAGGVGKFASETPKCPVMFHFGLRDPHIGADQRDAVAQHPEVAVYTYDAGHGFNCSERADYNADAASLARSRTLEFFRSKLLTH